MKTLHSSEEQNDLADDTNDAVDDIVAGLITGRPNFWNADNLWDADQATTLDLVNSTKKNIFAIV